MTICVNEHVLPSNEQISLLWGFLNIFLVIYILRDEAFYSKEGHHLDIIPQENSLPSIVIWVYAVPEECLMRNAAQHIGQFFKVNFE